MSAELKHTKRAIRRHNNPTTIIVVSVLLAWALLAPAIWDARKAKEPSPAIDSIQQQAR